MKTKNYSLAERERQFNSLKVGQAVFDEIQKVDGVIIRKDDLIAVYRAENGKIYGHTKLPVNNN